MRQNKKKTIACLFAIGLGIGAGANASTLIIATEGAYPPFNYMDSKNKLHGFDVDIANALCAELGTSCTLVAQDWDGMIPALLARRYDAIVSSMVVTEERKKKIAFTDRYYTTRLGIAVAKESPLAGVAPDNFNTLNVGAQSSSTQATYAEEVLGKSGANVKLYPTQDDANMDLANGRLDAVINDKFPMLDWLSKSGESCCRWLGEANGTDDHVAIAVRQDDDALRERLNGALARIIANGTYQKIESRYFSTSIY